MVFSGRRKRKAWSCSGKDLSKSYFVENRHAYCIIAHQDPVMLHVMVAMLDHPLNDIYIHIDRRVDITPFLEIKTKWSKVCFIPKRYAVEWGNPVQIDTELLIFEYAYNNGPYSYYHMMSGQDLPLRSQDRIHEFMDKEHPHSEFVTVNDEGPEYLQDLEYKTRYYHYFVKSLSDTNHSFSHYWHYFLHGLAIKVQKLFGVKRTYPFELKKSLHFASITHEFLTYLLSQKALIRKTFAHTLCCDEVFLQSILWNSPFRDNLYTRADGGAGSMRKIVWINHKAHVWNKNDIDILLSCPELFALKFTSRDPEILLMIAKHNGCLDAVQSILQKE